MAGEKLTAKGYLFDTRIGAEPVLISACLLGIPCRWHGRRAKKRVRLIERLKRDYVLVPVCPEQLGGMPTPRTSEMLRGTGAQVLDEGLRLIAPETGQDVTQFYVNGAAYMWVPKILAPDFQKFWHSRVVGGVYAMWALRSRVI